MRAGNDERATSQCRRALQDRPQEPPVADLGYPHCDGVIGAWLAWSTLSERGPLITISFETAEGLQANQSHVRHKDVEMGVVQKITLAPDLNA